MMQQLIICVETNEKAKTDIVYIKDTIDYYYKVDSKTSIKFICMGSKSKYNDKKILKDIACRTKQFKGDPHVIYCIDLDRIDIEPERKKEYDDIVKYCIQGNYELIWFCYDIEDVYWNRQSKDVSKVSDAGKFRSNSRIKNVPKKKLSCPNIVRHGSNILLIIDKYLKNT